MRVFNLFLYAAALTATARAAALPPAVSQLIHIEARQTSSAGSDNASNTPTPTSSSAPSSTSSNGSSSTASGSSSSAATTASSSQSSSSSHPPSSSTSVPPTSLTTALPAPTNATAPGSPDPLPINPSITPAVGLAGAILMITGIVYTLTGIKHRRLYIFFGAAYSTALAVMVLITYVSNPPVSNSVQGAFLCACVISGCLIGAAGVALKEVAEGLSCLLGGFCLGMWLLCLRSDGLIQSQAGRAVLIGVFSVAGYSLSFSQYTRNYGLIVCIAFAGATAIILGIDCFSRAGLKEFWLYLWNLNSQLFPLNTTTYPITRGIRVEIAGIILLLFAGIVSQLKLWRIVRERHERAQRHRNAEDDRRDAEDAARGRVIEKRTLLDRVRWERIYGNRHWARDNRKALRQLSESENGNSSFVGTVPESVGKSDTSITQYTGKEGYELPEISDLMDGKGKSRATIVVGPASPDSVSYNTHDDYRSDASSDVLSSVRGKTLSPGVRPPPPVLPHPFTSRSSAHLDTVMLTQSGEARRGSKRVSGGVVQEEKISMTDAEAHPVTHHDEDDGASSVAASLGDEELEEIKNMPRLSPFDRFEFEESNEKEAEVSKPARPVTVDFATMSNGQLSPSGIEIIRRLSMPEEANTSGAVTPPTPGSQGSCHSRAQSLEGHLPEKISKIAMEYRTNEWAKHIAIAAEPEHDELPERPESPAVQVEVSGLDQGAIDESYRLVANKQEREKLEAQVAEQKKAAEEKAAQAAAQRAAKKKSMEMLRQSKPVPVYAAAVSPPAGPSRQSSSQSLQQRASQSQAPAQRSSSSLARRSSAPLADRSSTQVPVNFKFAGSRTNSTNLLSQPLIESPNEDMPTSPHNPDAFKALSGHSTPTTFSSPQPFFGAALSGPNGPPRSGRSSPNSGSGTPPSARSTFRPTHSRSASASSLPSKRSLNDPDSDNISLRERQQIILDDDLTLAQRKSALRTYGQAQPQASYPQGMGMRNSSTPLLYGNLQPHQSMMSLQSQPMDMERQTPQWNAVGALPNSISTNAIYDAHQPLRQSSAMTQAQQLTKLAQWRESLVHQTRSKEPVAVMQQSQHSQLLAMQRQEQFAKEQGKMEREGRQNAMDNMMRHPDMQAIHRERLRAMQRKANAN